MTNTPVQLGIAAAIRVQTAAANSATDITDLRPTASEIGPVISRPIASMPVATDSDRLLVAASMPKASDRIGSSGWTQ